MKPYKPYVPPGEHALAFVISLAIIALVCSAVVCTMVLKNRTIETVREHETRVQLLERKVAAMEDMAGDYGYSFDEE